LQPEKKDIWGDQGFVGALSHSATGFRPWPAPLKALTKQDVADIRCKVKGLKRFQAILNNFAGQWHDDEVPDRPVLDALTGLNWNPRSAYRQFSRATSSLVVWHNDPDLPGSILVSKLWIALGVPSDATRANAGRLSAIVTSPRSYSIGPMA
jgi:hypothetical protein